MNNALAFLLTSILIVLVILLLVYFINIPTNDYEKHSAYECGFEPFGDARSFFDIQFYTIGLLFIIFDLEIVFLIPFVIDISNISFFGYATFFIFMIIVLLGFYYEWSIGLLNWVPNKVFSVATTITIAPFFTCVDLLKNIDVVFGTIWSLIVISLLLNQLSSLIHRILNLAGLSILVVALWSYQADLIFLFIVYVLAFVGAVVMLFLSVVLMLPTSVIVNKYQYIVLLPNSVNIVYELNNFFILPLSTVDFFIFVLVIIISNLAWPYIINTDIQVILKYLYSNVTRFSIFIQNYPGFKSYFALDWPLEVIRSLTKTDTRQQNLEKRFYPILYWNDFLYYVYVNIDNKLYKNSAPNFKYKKTTPTWKLFNIFEDKFDIAKPEYRRFFPITDLFTFYIPFKFKYSLFNILPPIYHIEKGQYSEGDSNLIRFWNRLVFIRCFFEFFTINIVYRLYNVLRKTSVKKIYHYIYFSKYVQLSLSWFGFNYDIGVIRSMTNQPNKAEYLADRHKLVIYFHDFLYYIYYNIDIRLYSSTDWESWRRYKYIKPLWGKLFDKFNILSRPAEFYRERRFLALPSFTPVSDYIPYRYKYSLFNIFPPIYSLRPGQYFVGESKFLRFLNYLIFTKCLLEFLVCNTVLVVWFKLSGLDFFKAYELLKQSFALISILCLSIPVTFNGNRNNHYFVKHSTNTDNLIAIKSVLYENEPSLLLVSVIVLLIALIGSAVLTRTNKKIFENN